MYMRLLQAKARPEVRDSLREFYQDTVVNELKKVPGCLFASLIQSGLQEQDWISMTLWDSQAHAEAFQQSAIFKKILTDLHPFLSESSEWKIQLSNDLELQYSPAPEVPVIKSYSVVAHKDLKPTAASIDRLFTRIVSHKLQQDKKEEFEKIYKEEIIPALKEIRGCLYAYLMENIKDSNEVISVTIWQERNHARQYEKSGQFDQLVDKLKHTFSQLYQWKMSLEKDDDSRVRTTDDMAVALYTNVTGQKFFRK